MSKASKQPSHPDKKAEKTQAGAAATHHAAPEHVDDRPKRDDDDLSALLQTSDPESSTRGKPAKEKK